MADTLETALVLMFVGMAMVFFILFLVVFTGNLLVRALNFISDDSNYSKITKFTSSLSGAKPSPLPSKQLALIIATVDAVTEGKGRVEKIEKMDET